MSESPYTLSLAQLRKLDPCASDLARVSALMPKRGGIDAAEARRLGCSYNDIIWVASAIAMDDDALARRLTHFVNDNAKAVLHVWEERWPDDDRPRTSIEACDGFLAGTVTEEEWKAAARDAWDAWAARDAWDARDARAARDAWDAAFHGWQFDRLIYWLTEENPVPLPMPEKGVPAITLEVAGEAK